MNWERLFWRKEFHSIQQRTIYENVWRLEFKNRNLSKMFLMISCWVTSTILKKTPLSKDFVVLLYLARNLSKFKFLKFFILSYATPSLNYLIKISHLCNSRILKTFRSFNVNFVGRNDLWHNIWNIVITQQHSAKC